MAITKYTVGVAGSTHHTLLCAQALAADERFKIEWILTPPPQPVGRKQVITPNPLHTWADTQHIPVTFVEKKIRPELREALPSQPDFLLVADFGYLVPKWLLELPRIAPINIHPSVLPRWRGSSPGQFVLLDGELDSAVTIMVMGEGLDTGPLLWQEEFTLDMEWTQTEYYHHSFTLAARRLGTVLDDVATGKVLPQPQSDASPTPIARRLNKEDGYVSWKTLAPLVDMGYTEVEGAPESDSVLILQSQVRTGAPLSKTIADAVRALAPWPGVWTIVPTAKGAQRLKILTASYDAEKGIAITLAQIEGSIQEKWGNITKSIRSL